jgi:hypothetical protein
MDAVEQICNATDAAQVPKALRREPLGCCQLAVATAGSAPLAIDERGAKDVTTGTGGFLDLRGGLGLRGWGEQFTAIWNVFGDAKGHGSILSRLPSATENV